MTRSEPLEVGRSLGLVAIATALAVSIGCGGGTTGGGDGGSNNPEGCTSGCSTTCSITLSGAVTGTFPCNNDPTTGIAVLASVDQTPTTGVGASSGTAVIGNGMAWAFRFSGGIKTGSFTTANTTAATATVTDGTGYWMMNEASSVGTFSGASFTTTTAAASSGGETNYAVTGGTFDATLISTSSSSTVTMHCAF